MTPSEAIRRAQALRAEVGAGKQRLLQLNRNCLDSFAMTLYLLDQLIEQRKALARREPWLAARG